VRRFTDLYHWLLSPADNDLITEDAKPEKIYRQCYILPVGCQLFHATADSVSKIIVQRNALLKIFHLNHVLKTTPYLFTAIGWIRATFSKEKSVTDFLLFLMVSSDYY
jgi:hypothetical protein